MPAEAAAPCGLAAAIEEEERFLELSDSETEMLEQDAGKDDTQQTRAAKRPAREDRDPAAVAAAASIQTSRFTESAVQDLENQINQLSLSLNLAQRMRDVESLLYHKIYGPTKLFSRALRAVEKFATKYRGVSNHGQSVWEQVWKEALTSLSKSPALSPEQKTTIAAYIASMGGTPQTARCFIKYARVKLCTTKITACSTMP